jgi:hypothetical protein
LTFLKHKIYLASPYTHESQDVREKRVKKACAVAGAFIREGYTVFSPIAHGHLIASYSNLPIEYTFWEGLNKAFIEWSDTLWILPLKGWEASKGIRREIKIAKELNKEIYIYYGKIY